jgi:P4 family phage/plasmid primase-like protien
MALRHHYRDDPDAGMDVFDRWSAGEWWPGGTPINYVPEHVPGQWGSLRETKDGRTVTVATLFYQAIQAGWRPPVTFDTAAAFGVAAAPAETFNVLLERVQASGGDPRQTPGILGEIRAAGCNALQTALLAAELKNALKDAGIKDKAVSAHIDNMLSISTPGFSDAGMPGVYGKNDTDNASVFIDKNYPGGTLIKCDGEFFNYDGKIWRKLPLDSLKHQIAVDMSAARVSSSRVNSCIDLLSKLVPVRDGEINRHRADIIVFDNGTLHLPTNTLQRHDPEHYNTVMLPCAYDQAAEASQWLAFLHQIMDSDTERVALLQEWVGYLMINDYRHHKIMLLIGPKRCGKGTIGRVIQRLVGELNFTGGSLTSLARDSFIDSLRTKTALFIGDAAKRVPNAAINQVIERIKCISGNDAVDFDRKYLSGLSETLPTRITIAANSVPNLFDDSGALASRIMMLPLYQSFYGREDLNLLDKLLAELPGIACWALDGLRRLQQVGRFTVPAVSQWEYAQLQESYSPVLQFVTECCQIRLDVRCTSDELYACYRAWCVNQGENLMQRKTFVTSIRDALRERGVAYTKIDHTRGFHGLAPTATAPSNAVAFVPRVVT